MTNEAGGEFQMAIIPNAQEALDKFKMKAASEVGVNLKQDYNGDLTSRQEVLSVDKWLRTSIL